MRSTEHQRLQELLSQLRLRGMAEAFQTELQRAERTSAPPTELLRRLLLEEARHRAERSLAYRLDQAKLPWPWTLETFPFEQQPGVNKAQITTLAGLDFVRRADNLVLIGNPGTGKSGIAIGLLRQACLNGYRCRFYNAQTLLDELYASLADRSTAKLLNRLTRYDALLIDELGYLTLKPDEAWYELFQKKTLVDALLDRLQHHCITIHIDGPSLRTPRLDPSDATGKQNSTKKKHSAAARRSS